MEHLKKQVETMKLYTRSDRIMNTNKSNVYRLDSAGQGSALLIDRRDGLSDQILKCFDRLSVAITNTLNISGCLIYLRHRESHLVLASSNATHDVKDQVPFIANFDINLRASYVFESCPLSDPASIFPDAEKIFLIESDRVTEDTSVGLLVASDLDNDHLNDIDTQFCEATLGLIRRVFRFYEYLQEKDRGNFDACQEIEDMGVLASFGIRLGCRVNKVALFSKYLETDKFFASCGLEDEQAPSAHFGECERAGCFECIARS